MACRSASAQRAQKKSSEALKAIERLVKDVENLAASEEADFQQKISKFKDQLETDDFKELAGDSATKVDFTHEFDADALTAVITNVLSAAATVISGTSATRRNLILV